MQKWQQEHQSEAPRPLMLMRLMSLRRSTDLLSQQDLDSGTVRVGSPLFLSPKPLLIPSMPRIQTLVIRMATPSLSRWPLSAAFPVLITKPNLSHCFNLSVARIVRFRQVSFCLLMCSSSRGRKTAIRKSCSIRPVCQTCRPISQVDQMANVRFPRMRLCGNLAQLSERQYSRL